MPPRDYEGATASGFNAAVGGALGGFSKTEELRGNRRKMAIDDRESRARSQDAATRTALAAAEAGFSIGGTTPASPTGDASSAPAANAPTLATPATPARAAARRPFGPQMDDDVGDHEYRTPGDTTSIAPPPVSAHGPVSDADSSVHSSQSFAQRIGHALSGGAHAIASRAKSSLADFRDGGVQQTDAAAPTITRTGPSQQERVAGIQATARVDAVNAHEANDPEIARIRANATITAANIRASAAAARATNNSGAMRLVMGDIDKEQGRLIQQLNVDQRDPALRSENADDPASVTAATQVRNRMQATRDALQDLQVERNSMRAGVLGASAGNGTPISGPPAAQPAGHKFTLEQTKARARALYQAASRYKDATEAEKQEMVAKQMRKEGYNVQ